MKYKVTLEFVVHPYGDDRELPEEEIKEKADHAIKNNLEKYNSLICDTIGFPGDLYLIESETL